MNRMRPRFIQTAKARPTLFALAAHFAAVVAVRAVLYGQVLTNVSGIIVDQLKILHALAAIAGTHPLPVVLSPSIPLATSSGSLDIAV